MRWWDGGVFRLLRGRREECAELDGLVEAVQSGESRALVVLGEPGVGKTALLEYMVRQARGVRIARITGVQSEMELAFSGLHQLCAPMSDHLHRLPRPQRDALRKALGLSSGPAPDRFLVGLATLGLLAEAARDRPLLCLVDDAQWLDRASLQALAFTARRLLAESVAIVFAERVPDEAPEKAAELAGLPELLVAGLPDEDARALLHAALPGRWDEQVLERIVAETRGNPLALLELSAESIRSEFAGGFGLPGERALTGRIQEIYQRRVVRLPPETQQLLLVAAAEPGGEPALLWRAADRLAVGIDAATPALSAGLLQIGDRVQFHHPLVRSAVYWAASPDERRRAHRVLAEVTDAQTAPDRRAWHMAQAAHLPDEGIAAELERSAGRAQARGGVAAAAAFLARAVELTPDPARRQERALAAAQATHQAGTADTALRLLSIAEAGPLDQLRRGQVELVRAQIAFTMERGGDAPLLLLKAARQLEPHDVPLARETYLDAISAALFAGPLANGSGKVEAAMAARSAPPAQGAPRLADLLLDGLAQCIAEGLAAGAAKLGSALDVFRGPGLSEEEALRWAWLTSLTAVTLWDYESWDLLTARHLQLARQTGRTTELPLALTSRIAVHALGGQLTTAAALVEEVTTVSEAIGIPQLPYGALVLAAWQGREADSTALMKTIAAEATRRGEGNGLTVSKWTRAVLCNSLGRYKDTLAAVPEAGEDHVTAIPTETWALPEFIEAAIRGGSSEHAATALRRLSKLARSSRTDWVLGLEARSRALLSTGTPAEDYYREAIERLGRTPIRGELARSHLLYGEWLRREHRQQDARQQLRTAHESFTAMGMEGFAQRAARELLAGGEQVRKHAVETTSALTAQEAQIVRLVRDGLTNPEIGTRLFISPRTVEWHLRKIFSKLGVASRRQLQRSTFGDGAS